MREHIRRISRLAVVFLVNVALVVALLVIIEGLSSYAFFLRELVPRLRESNLKHTQYDAEVGWVGLPTVDIKDMYGPGAHLRTNAQGFRNAEDFPVKRAGDMRRIVCSGDSVTFGEHVGNDQTFCNVLAELDPKIETINMGQVGYGVDQAYLWYKRDADALDVDVHVFAFITHDFTRMQYDRFMGIPRPVVVLEDGKPVVTNAPISEATYATPTWLAESLNSADGLRTLKLATKIRKRLNLAPSKVPGPWDARGAEEVKAVVTGMFEYLRDYDSARSRTTVLVYFPSVEELQQPNAELGYWMSVVESNAQRLDIPFIDFVSVFGELPAAEVTSLFVDGYHFSEKGNALVAREILEHLRDDPRTAGRFTAPRQNSNDKPAPDPGVCTPQTCESLGHVCGKPQDGCRNTLSCGACSNGDVCVGGTCSSPGVTGVPYGHVTPSDVGVTIGVGVVAPVPTAPYTGPREITADDTLIENVVMDEFPIIRADRVTFRNVIIDGGSPFWGWDAEDCDGCVLEYSKLVMGGDGKLFRINNSTNITVRNNELIGGQDWVWFGRNKDEIYIEDNYFHTFSGGAGSHSDGFQGAETATVPGTIYIRGNYFDPDPDVAGGLNDLLFLAEIDVVVMENNFFKPWGYYTLRCLGVGPVSACNVRNNVYSDEYVTMLPAAGAPSRAVLYDDPDLAARSAYECNRYENGNFIEQQWISGQGKITHVTTGCPSYP